VYISLLKIPWYRFSTVEWGDEHPNDFKGAVANVIALPLRQTSLPALEFALDVENVLLFAGRL